MNQSAEIWDELQSMKDDIGRALNAKAEGIKQASSSHLDALTEQIKAGLDELGNTLNTLKDEEEHLEHIVAAHPVAAVASAFALGVIIGLSFRRLI